MAKWTKLKYINKDGKLFNCDKYQIDKYGIIKGSRGVLKHKISSSGYATCYVYNNGVRLFISINRAILSSWKTDEYALGDEADHIDNNSRNDRLDNLTWLAKDVNRKKTNPVAIVSDRGEKFDTVWEACKEFGVTKNKLYQALGRNVQVAGRIWNRQDAEEELWKQ